jgi:hypothetical protein
VEYLVDGGKIEYRQPNVKEMLGLLKVVSRFQGKEKSLDSNIELLEFMLDEIKKYITKVEIGEVNSYKKLIESHPHALDLIGLITEFISGLDLDKKKAT